MRKAPIRAAAARPVRGFTTTRTAPAEAPPVIPMEAATESLP